MSAERDVADAATEESDSSDVDDADTEGSNSSDAEDSDSSDVAVTTPATSNYVPKVASEREAAVALLRYAHEYVRRLDREEYMVLVPDKVWRSMNETKAIREVAVRVTKATLRWKGKGKKIARKHHHQSVAVSSQIAKQMLREMKETPHFVEKLQESAHMRLFYRDGFYDFERGEFTSEEGPGVVTASRISRRFPKAPGPIATQEFMDRVLIPIFPIEDERVAFLTYLARGLAGVVAEKRWCAFIGERNVGKGVLTGALRAAFPRVVRDLQGRHLMDGMEVESEREFAFAMDKMEHSAIAICNELPKHGNLNGDKIKSLASGGDKLSARNLYAEPRDFLPRARLLLCANKLPKVTPDDAIKTLAWFTGRTEFILDRSELTDQEKSSNAAFELDPFGTSLRFSIGDADIKRYVKSPKAIRAFTHILLRSFRADVGRTSLSYLPAYVLEPARTNGVTVSAESAITERVVATGIKKDFVAEDRIKHVVRARTRQPIEHSRIAEILVALSREAGIVDEKALAAKTARGVAGGRISGWRFVRERTPEELAAFKAEDATE
jgi:hypothetical protein